MVPLLELSLVEKTYPGPRGEAVIVRDVSLQVAEGEFICILGPSGCGKSTVLSMLAGLSAPSAGAVLMAGREVAGPAPDRAMMFQSPCLLPWLTALDNVRLGLDQSLRHRPAAERRDRAMAALAKVGLAVAAGQRPGELSQGMRQRVSLARALALEPRVLLLDEPFGMLDSLTRLELQEQLAALWQRERRTAVMVTHDVDEALALSDRVAIFTRGPGATIGRVLTVPYSRPRRRRELLEDPGYPALREQLLGFLEHDDTPAGVSLRPDRLLRSLRRRPSECVP